MKRITKRKTGRPTKLGPTQRERVRHILSVGGSLADAAASIGVEPSTLRKLRARDPAFSQGVKEATAAGKMALIERVHKDEDWKAAAWMLERKWGSEFGRKEPLKVEHTGANGGPIETRSEVKHSVDYDAIEAELQAIAGGRMAGGVPADN